MVLYNSLGANCIKSYQGDDCPKILAQIECEHEHNVQVEREPEHND